MPTSPHTPDPSCLLNPKAMGQREGPSQTPCNVSGWQLSPRCCDINEKMYRMKQIIECSFIQLGNNFKIKVQIQFSAQEMQV